MSLRALAVWPESHQTVRIEAIPAAGHAKIASAGHGIAGGMAVNADGFCRVM